MDEKTECKKLKSIYKCIIIFINDENKQKDKLFFLLLLDKYFKILTFFNYNKINIIEKYIKIFIDSDINLLNKYVYDFLYERYQFLYIYINLLQRYNKNNIILYLCDSLFNDDYEENYDDEDTCINFSLTCLEYNNIHYYKDKHISLYFRYIFNFNYKNKYYIFGLYSLIKFLTFIKCLIKNNYNIKLLLNDKIINFFNIIIKYKNKYIEDFYIYAFYRTEHEVEYLDSLNDYNIYIEYIRNNYNDDIVGLNKAYLRKCVFVLEKLKKKINKISNSIDCKLSWMACIYYSNSIK